MRRTPTVAVILSLAVAPAAQAGQDRAPQPTRAEAPDAWILRTGPGRALVADDLRALKASRSGVAILDASGVPELMTTSRPAAVRFGRPTGTAVSIYGGRSPRGWVEGAQAFDHLRVDQLAPGVDLVVSRGDAAPHVIMTASHARQLASLAFRSAPGTEMLLDGGDLVLRREATTSRIGAPSLAQPGSGTAAWRIEPDGIVTVSVAGVPADDAVAVEVPLFSAGGEDALDRVRFQDVASADGELVGVGASTDAPTLLRAIRPNDPYAAAIARWDQESDLRSLVFITARHDVLASSVALAPDGSAILGGSTRDPFLPQRAWGLPAGRHIGTFNAFAASVTPDGLLRWADAFGAPEVDEIADVAVAQDGTVALAGETWGASLFPVRGQVFVRVVTDHAAFLIRRTAAGQILDSSVFGAGGVRLKSVDAVNDGFVLSGDVARPDLFRAQGRVYGSPDRYRGATEPQGDVFAIKVPAGGNFVGSTAFLGGSGRQQAAGVVARGDRMVVGVTQGDAEQDAANDLRSHALDGWDAEWTYAFFQGVGTDEGTDQIDHEPRAFYGSRLSGREHILDLALGSDGSLHSWTAPASVTPFNISQIGLRRLRADGTFHSYYGYEQIAGNRAPAEVSFIDVVGVTTDETTSVLLLRDRGELLISRIPI